MNQDEEELSEVGVGSPPWGWRGSGELPLAVPGPSGRPGQEPLPIWDSNTDSHFRRTLLQLRVPLVIGPSGLLALPSLYRKAMDTPKPRLMYNWEARAR